MLTIYFLQILAGLFCLNILKKNHKQVCLLVSFLIMCWTLILCVISPMGLISYYKLERWYLDYGLDNLSSIFLLLTNLVMVISVLASWGDVKIKNEKLFYSILLILHFILILVFLSVNILSFYIFFEASLIPMFLLIGIYGSRGRKIYAAYLFFLMTLAGSLATLLAFLIIISDVGSYDYLMIRSIGISPEREWIIWLGVFLSFAVKTPVVPLHLWLPEAHTEANVSGSIILAGILLKLSTYGFLRFSIGCLSKSSLYYMPLVYVISVISLIYSSLATLRQIDLKKIIAYSSIGHMSLVNIGIFTQNYLGLDGAIYLTISHGISSPGLFILVTLLYERFHTRIIKYYRGIVYKMPIYSIYFMIFILSNMAIPLTGNFIGELLILAGSFSINSYMTILASLGIILSGGYSIWLNNRILFGKLTEYLKDIRDVYYIEFLILLPLVIILVVMGVSHIVVGSIIGPISLIHSEV